MGGIRGHCVWWIILMLARWISHLPWAFDNMTLGSYNILMLPPQSLCGFNNVVTMPKGTKTQILITARSKT